MTRIALPLRVALAASLTGCAALVRAIQAGPADGAGGRTATASPSASPVGDATAAPTARPGPTPSPSPTPSPTPSPEPTGPGGSQVRAIEAIPNGTASIEGDLSEGGTMPSLSWANTAQLACWPSTQNEYFNGNHVLFTTALPRRTVMDIRLQPAPDVDLSLWAYSTGASAPPRLPPNIYTGVCEESHLRGVTSINVTQNPGVAEAVMLNAIANPYNVVIGVAGPRKAATGSFTLYVTLTGGEE